jgi:hypothetical protein
VPRLMTRLAIIALLAVLAAAPAAQADSTRTKILRECQNGRLTGDYTAKQIRDARNNIPDDLDQYSDCRDVLTRALLNRAGSSNDGGGGGGGGSTGGAGASGGGGGGDGGEVLTPSTDADRKALEGAAAEGAQPLQVAGGHVTPGAAGSLRNNLPATLLVVLALLAAAAAAGIAPFLRRRAFGSLVALGPALRRRVLPRRSG